MESQARYTLVGGIVVAGIVAITFVVLWLYDQGGPGDTKQFAIYFKDQTLDGLQVDSYVTMRGIKVGNVSSIKLSEKNIELVKVLLKVDITTPVKVDTQAVIKRNILTGLAYVELTNSSNQSPPLEVVQDGESVPVIPEGKSGLDQFAASLPSLVDDVHTLVENASGFLSPENEARFANIMKGAETTSLVLAQNDKQLDEIIRNSTTFSRDLVQFDKRFTGFVERTDRNLEELTKNLSTTAQEIGQLATSLRKDTSDAAQSLRNSSDLFLQQMTVLTQSVNEATETFTLTLEKFQDPRSVLVGPSKESLGPGETIRE